MFPSESVGDVFLKTVMYWSSTGTYSATINTGLSECVEVDALGFENAGDGMDVLGVGDLNVVTYT